jgi:SET domain-containing protein
MNKIFSIILIIIIIISFLLNILFYYKFYNKKDKLYINESTIPNSGKGVFTSKYITKDEIIEKSPIIVQDTIDFKGQIKDYLFSYNNDFNKAAVGFGYTSLYNHSDNNNAYWYTKDDHVYIIALRDINENEEIFISYGDPYWKDRENEKYNNI